MPACRDAASTAVVAIEGVLVIVLAAVAGCVHGLLRHRLLDGRAEQVEICQLEGGRPCVVLDVTALLHNVDHHMMSVT